MGEKEKLKKVKCKKCGDEWVPRVSAPKKCPACQSREWDYPLSVFKRVALPGRRDIKNK